MNCLLLRFCIATAMLTFPICAFSQQISINEVMSSNETYLADKDGDFSDWIEIYNESNFTVNLNQYSLSDDITDLKKWKFPSFNLPAKGFVVVFASGKDDDFIFEMHTNFRLSQPGETLYLTNPGGEIVSSVIIKALGRDCSYGSVPDGSHQFTTFTKPSHNASNALSNGVYASHESGFYDEVFPLTLVAADTSHKIYYTLNGNTPTTSSFLYQKEELKIEPNVCNNYAYCDDVYSRIPTTPLEGPDRLNGYIWKNPRRLYRGQIIRFASFQNDSLVSQVYTKTYFTDPEVDQRYTFPIISIITDSLNFFGHKNGIYIPGERFEQEGFGYRPYGNYMNDGLEWERKVHFTYFENDGTIAFETDAGVRLRGVGSSANPQKSLNVYFRKDYGLNEIKYPVFPKRDHDNFKRLILRNSGTDFLYTHFRDAILQDIIMPLGLELQHFTPSVVFLNGEYWGIHNIREKFDKFYFEYNHGVSEDNLNIVDFKGVMEDGSNADYLALLDFVENNDLSLEANYDYVAARVDIQNFIDFQIAEIYYANYDWPCNNYKVWKTNDVDSKWRFIIYDLDESFSARSEAQYFAASLNHATTVGETWPHCPESNVLFRKLLTNEDFKTTFIKRFVLHLKTIFDREAVLDKIKQYEELFLPEMYEHIERWHYPRSVNQWYREIDKMKYFALKRPCYLKAHLMDFFDLTELDFECPDFEDASDAGLFSLYPNPNNGSFSIQKNSLISSTGRLSVVNVEGKTVYSENDIRIDSYHTFNIDLNKKIGIPSGVYFISFTNSSVHFQRKVVVVK